MAEQKGKAAVKANSRAQRTPPKGGGRKSTAEIEQIKVKTPQRRKREIRRKGERQSKQDAG